MLEQMRGDISTGNNQVLAVVQYEQGMFSFKVIGHELKQRTPGLVRQPERGSDNVGHERRIGQRSQLDPPNAIGVDIQQIDGYGLRQPCFAHPTRTGQRHQMILAQQLPDFRYLAFASDQVREREGQVAAARA